jgi:uncharacterized protein YaaR (DUF327 family)
MGKVFKIIFAINHRLPSLIENLITHLLSTIKKSDYINELKGR